MPVHLSKSLSLYKALDVGEGPREMQLANFDSPTKRSFLNECIRQIYIISGRLNILPNLPSPIEYNKSQIWAMVNYSLRPALKSDSRAAIMQVRRQLFREPRRQTRKTRTPKKRSFGLHFEIFDFRAMQSLIGRKKVRRSYLDGPRRRAVQELKKYWLNAFAAEEASQQSAGASSYRDCQQKCNIMPPGFLLPPPQSDQRYPASDRRRSKRHQQQCLEQQYTERLEANERILQESIRALYYMKTLLGLIVDQEERLYV